MITALKLYASPIIIVLKLCGFLIIKDSKSMGLINNGSQYLMTPIKTALILCGSTIIKAINLCGSLIITASNFVGF